MQASDGSQDGFILVVVLGFLALFSVVVLALSHAIRLDVQARSHLVSGARAEALADGLALLVAARLAEQQAGSPGKPLPADGSPMRCRVGDNLVEISITDATGLVDINAAPVELLERVLAGLGLPGQRAKALAAAIGDFRDEDDEPLPNGAEAKEYLAAGLSHGPKNAPFDSVEELDQVIGMTREVLTKLREVVTVNAQSPALEIRFSPPELIAALAGLRSRVPVSALRIRNARARLQGEFISSGGGLSKTQVVVVTVETSSQGRFRRRSVIEVNSASNAGFYLREWAPAPSRSISGYVAPFCSL